MEQIDMIPVYIPIDATHELIDTLNHMLRTGQRIIVAYDPIDQAFKVKCDGRWSPPIGSIALPVDTEG